MIIYNALDVKIPIFPKRKVSSWIKRVASNYNFKVGNVSYIFCSDEKILEINNKYLSHNYFTDVITFDYTLDNTISGDIFVSIETVVSNANQYHVNHLQELYRVMIHSILHLCGLKDTTKEEKLIMTNKENETLKLFNEI